MRTLIDVELVSVNGGGCGSEDNPCQLPEVVVEPSSGGSAPAPGSSAPAPSSSSGG